jgi:hypothetical protein
MIRDHFRVLVVDLTTGKGKVANVAGRDEVAGGSGPSPRVAFGILVMIGGFESRHGFAHQGNRFSPGEIPGRLPVFLPVAVL